MYQKKRKKEKKKKHKPELITVSMEVVLKPPPDHIYKRAQEVFGKYVIDFKRGTIFAYGKYIHAARPIDRDFLAHESVHGRAQIIFPGGPDAWWEKYFTDKKFRYAQELEAYRAQYRYLQTVFKDRNKQNHFLLEYATDFSGAMYGNMITFSEATKLIKQI